MDNSTRLAKELDDFEAYATTHKSDRDDLELVLAKLQEQYGEKIKQLQAEETSANVALAQSDDILRERIRGELLELLLRDKSIRNEIERHALRHVDTYMREFRQRLQSVFN